MIRFIYHPFLPHSIHGWSLCFVLIVLISVDCYSTHIYPLQSFLNPSMNDVSITRLDEFGAVRLRLVRTHCWCANAAPVTSSLYFIPLSLHSWLLFVLCKNCQLPIFRLASMICIAVEWIIKSKLTVESCWCCCVSFYLCYPSPPQLIVIVYKFLLALTNPLVHSSLNPYEWCNCHKIDLD